jgi:hypothetical protein
MEIIISAMPTPATSLLPDGPSTIESGRQGLDADSISQNTETDEEKSTFHPGAIKETASPDTDPLGSIRK